MNLSENLKAAGQPIASHQSPMLNGDAQKDLQLYESATANLEKSNGIKVGIVSGCFFLNVRAEAKMTAEVLCVIGEFEEVIIDVKNSTDKFYKICTASGMFGFCMKKFIAMK